MKRSVYRLRCGPFLAAMALMFFVGIAPALLVLIVDPYGLLHEPQRPAKLNEVAEKAHYPLWKLGRYVPGHSETIVLGDSRARALREKYWKELGHKTAVNLAYGGGTIPEIYTTFKYIKDDPRIENLIVGIQLRSFDEDHKGGMNRVPEAIGLLQNPLGYLTNWSVFKTAGRILWAEQRQRIAKFARDPLFMRANAMDRTEKRWGKPGAMSTDKLLHKDVCYSCDHAVRKRSKKLARPQLVRRKMPKKAKSAVDLVGLYSFPDLKRRLPAAIARQTGKNARSDWKGFEESSRYWQHLEEISAWSRERNVNLLFVVPPTIGEMQRTIAEYGLAEENLKFRNRLAQLGTVLDFDFPNEVTKKIANFTDAYHPKAPVSRMIVGEAVMALDPTRKQSALVVKRRKSLACPDLNKKKKALRIGGGTYVLSGKGCRIWRASL